MNEVNPPAEELQESQPIEIAQELSFIERHGISPVLFGFLSLIFVFISYQLVGGLLSILATGGIKALINFSDYSKNMNVSKMRVVTGLGQVIFIFLPTLFLVRLATKTPKDYLRLRLPSPSVFIFPMIGIFSLQQLLQIYMIAQEKIPLPERVVHFINQFKELLEQTYKMLVISNSIPELLFVILVVALIPAFVEELLFRGLVQRSFENGLTPMKGVLLTGIIFGVYHLNPFAFIPLALLGMYLGFLTLRANSVWVSVVAHFLNNAGASLAMYLHLDEDAIVTGDPNAMSFKILAMTFFFFGILFFGSTYFFIRLTENKSIIQTTERDFVE